MPDPPPAPTSPADQAVLSYGEILRLRPLGDHERGEIEILPPEGEPGPGSGIVYADRFVTLIRDRVRFPDGEAGGYLRLVENASLTGSVGSAVLPVTVDGGVVLVRTFRHATRRWEIEIPRGLREAAVEEAEVQTARRELAEEVGLRTEGPFERIGVVAPNTGMLASEVPLFRVRVARDLQKPVEADGHEAISGLVILPREVVLEQIRSGKIRDSFTLAAMLLDSLNPMA